LTPQGLKTGAVPGACQGWSFLVLGDASIHEEITGFLGMCVLLVNHSHGLEIIAGPPVLLTLVSREVSGSLILSKGTLPESCHIWGKIIPPWANTVVGRRRRRQVAIVISNFQLESCLRMPTIYRLEVTTSFLSLSLYFLWSRNTRKSLCASAGDLLRNGVKVGLCTLHWLHCAGENIFTGKSILDALRLLVPGWVGGPSKA